MFEPFENLNPIVVEDVHVFNPKKWKKTFDTNVNHKFQDVLALKMPWAKVICNEIELVISMKCHVCSKIEKDEVLVLKWDSIEKHAGKRKVPNGKWFMDPKVGMQKMKLLMLSYQQQLSSNILILVR
jgi:hypothetical protein